MCFGCMILLVPNLEAVKGSVEWGCFMNLEGNKASVFLNVSPDGYMHDNVTVCGLGWVAPRGGNRLFPAGQLKAYGSQK
jgi:hypothetical protein